MGRNIATPLWLEGSFDLSFYNEIISRAHIGRKGINCQIFLFIALTLLCGIAGGTAVGVNVQSSSQTVQKGQQFIVNISIDPAGNPISGAQFNLMFNGSLASINKISGGNLLNSSGAKTMFNPGVINNSLGKVINVWGLIIVPGSSVTKKNNFAEITFTSKTNGTFSFSLTNVIVTNPASVALQTSISNVTFNNAPSPATSTPPPASIASLKNVTFDPDYIRWTWIDPQNTAFSGVMVYVNGIFIKTVPKGTAYFNATGLNPDTSYTISTHTVSTSGNVNGTWVNNTARTAKTTSGVIFFDSMEAGTANWAATGLWHLNTKHPNSPNHSFWYGQESTGNYDTVSNGNSTRNYGYLMSREMSLLGATNPVLSFMSMSQVEPYDQENYDTMWVAVSADNGNSWTNLLKISDINVTWSLKTIRLADYAGKKIRIRFFFDTVDNSYNDYEGWYVDDVKIYQSSSP